MSPTVRFEGAGPSVGAKGLLRLPASIGVDSAAQVLAEVTFEYQGVCPVTGEELVLPRTVVAEQLCRHLQDELGAFTRSEGKMFGVLVFQDELGELGYLKAYSGQFSALENDPSWAPPLHLYQPSELEESTLAELSRCKARLWELAEDLERLSLPAEEERWEREFRALQQRHQAAKIERRRWREQRPQERSEWDRQSQRDSAERAGFRRQREQALAPIKARRRVLLSEVSELKRHRKAVSRKLQRQLHQEFLVSVSLRLGCSLEELFPEGLPTGTGDCCAPKLLNQAIQLGIHPLALAEFWWGTPSTTGRSPGTFYPACASRCQPLLGPLLRRAQTGRVRILYDDHLLLVADKPAGMLTVPGRTGQQQDSLLTRLGRSHGELFVVHRLDFETSGLVVLARNPEVGASLQQQFARREVQKVYQAVLERGLEKEQTVIEAPLAADPERPGTVRVDPSGKPALTRLRVMGDQGRRVELLPVTGRTHQLRAHLAQALDCPIVGDRLYGPPQACGRLLLHAWRLRFRHPDGRWLEFEAPLPF